MQRSSGICLLMMLAMGFPKHLGAVQSDDRLLEVGDHVRYQVAEDGDAAVDLQVSNTGRLDIPYLGTVVAAGKTTGALVSELKAALEAEHYVTATIKFQVLAFSQRAVNRGRVHLSGQVRQVGPLEIDLSDKPTLGRTILAAGGLADFADARNVRIVRSEGSESRTITVDLREVLNRGKIEMDVPLQDGDLIIVDQRLVNW